MYNLNDLQRNVLITPEEVIFHAPTDHTFDRIKVRNAIIIAEERFVRPALSSTLYDSLVDEKNTEADSLNIASLQDTIFKSIAKNNPGLNAEQITELQNNVILAEGDIVNSQDFLSPDNKKLWRQHLWKFTAECVLFIAMPTMFVQFASAGLVHALPTANNIGATGNVTPNLATVKFLMDRFIMDRLDPLKYSMQDYICSNKVSYAKYANACACDNVTSEAQHKRTDYITGLYDQPGCGLCDWDQLNGW